MSTFIKRFIGQITFYFIDKSLNMNSKLIGRLSNVVTRLDRQVKSGTKNTKEGFVPLTDKDLTRIKSEQLSLVSRIDKLKSRY